MLDDGDTCHYLGGIIWESEAGGSLWVWGQLVCRVSSRVARGIYIEKPCLEKPNQTKKEWENGCIVMSAFCITIFNLQSTLTWKVWWYGLCFHFIGAKPRGNSWGYQKLLLKITTHPTPQKAMTVNFPPCFYFFKGFKFLLIYLSIIFVYVSEGPAFIFSCLLHVHFYVWV